MIRRCAATRQRQIEQIRSSNRAAGDESEAATDSEVPKVDGRIARNGNAEIEAGSKAEPISVVEAVSSKEAAVELEQERIDAILNKLFFSPQNTVISEGVLFDAALRYLLHMILTIFYIHTFDSD